MRLLNVTIKYVLLYVTCFVFDTVVHSYKTLAIYLQLPTTGEKLMQLLQTSASQGGAHSGDSSTNLSRSVSSVGEHSTGASTPPLPKRADTFSGFESKENHRGQSLSQ